MKKYILHVSGTHCASCKILIEDVLSEQDFIKNSEVNLKNETVSIETEADLNPKEISEILTDKLKSNGYTFSLEKVIKKEEGNNVTLKSVFIGLVFLFLFFVLQKSGILNFGIGGEVTPITSFIIGIVASLSSCLAIVGGLVLSLSAKVSQDEGLSARKTFTLFHFGRLFGFAILGGILGLIGGVIGISFMFSAILGLIASVVMILLGFNLVGVLKKNKLTLSGNIFSFFRKIENTFWAPLLVGVGTFFLPCGFTQAMQISALSSGSFVSGLLLMFSFALGTLPVLVLLSFGSVSFSQSKYAPIFFKSAGVVVIGLGIFALLSGLAGVGLINPLFNL